MSEDDFDRSVRSTLAEAARLADPPAGLDDRLIANARAGRQIVTALHRPGRRGGWTLPLLAAASIVLVAGGAYGVSQLAGPSERPKPPAGSHRPVPTGLPTTTSVPTHVQVPNPAPSRRADAPPTDFRAATVSFRDPKHGVALGVGNCASVAAASCKVMLIATDDGGASWQVLGVPRGLHSMFPTTGADGSCGSNGDVLGPCVDNVLFADDRDGYLYGLHEFYWTDDGGRTWHHAPKPAGSTSEVPTVNNVPALVAANGYAYRMFSAHESSSGAAGRLQRAPIGTNDWTDISPVNAGLYTSFVAVSGSVLYLDAGMYAGNEHAQLYRSTDHGDHWQQVGSDSPSLATSLSSMAVAPDGAVALSTSDCTVYTAAPDGISFSKHDLPGGCHDSNTYVAGMASVTDLTVVADPGPTDKQHVQLYHSSDGGASYQPVASNEPPGTSPTSTISMTGDFGYVAGPVDRLEVTFDGGRTWESRSFSE